MKFLKSFFIISTLLCASCSDFLDEQVFTEYDPGEFLNTESGINAVLAATYRQSRPLYRETWFSFAGWTTDLQIERGGGYAAPAATFANFQWQPSNNFFRNNWREIYEAIRNANSLLDNIDNATSISGDKVASLKGEAQFLRAFNYTVLYDLFGPVPLVTTGKELRNIWESYQGSSTWIARKISIKYKTVAKSSRCLFTGYRLREVYIVRRYRRFVCGRE